MRCPEAGAQRGPVRALATLALGALLTVGASGQAGGIRVLPGDYVLPMGRLGYLANGFGLGYDRDLNGQLSFGIDVAYSIAEDFTFDHERTPLDLTAVEVVYRAAFTGHNDRGAPYIGSWMGLRKSAYGAKVLQGNGAISTKEGSTFSVPLGLRLGVRGGLQGFYADLFLALGYNVGGQMYGASSDGRTLVPISLQGTQFRLGLDLGVGWDHRSSR